MSTMTPQVVNSVLYKLANSPKEETPHAMRRGWPNRPNNEYGYPVYHWTCRCLYCRLQMLYVYYNIVDSQNNSLNRTVRSRNNVSNTLYKITAIRKNVSNLCMNPDLIQHLKRAKKEIGHWHKSDLVPEALKGYKHTGLFGLDDLFKEAEKFLSKHNMSSPVLRTLDI